MNNYIPVLDENYEEYTEYIIKLPNDYNFDNNITQTEIKASPSIKDLSRHLRSTTLEFMGINDE